LESLSIPKNIKSIGQRAFESAGTSSAAGFKVVLADGVESIGTGAFASSGLKSITMPASVTTLGGGVFSGCTALESIDLSALTITALEGFRGSSSLAEVKLPSTLETIGTNAFTDCSALAGITLPDGLTSLGVSAFSASGLTSITLPASLASLSSSVFSNCAKLQWVKILKEDALITLPTTFPFPRINSAYPSIYVPDDLFTQYAGDVELEQASQWTNCPTAAVPYIKRMSQFASDFPQ
jgi:hypothetical protein